MSSSQIAALKGVILAVLAALVAGGDGVYRKVRSKSLVNDYLRVSR